MAKGEPSPYSAIVFAVDKSIPPRKYGYVRNFYLLALWLDKNWPEWAYINAYDRKSGQYLRRIYRNAGFIPQKL